MAVELAAHEKKEKALTAAFDLLEKRRQLDQELGKALYALTELKVPQKSLSDIFNLTPREIKKLINIIESPTPDKENNDGIH